MSDNIQTLEGKIEPIELEDEMRSSFIDYAMSVLTDRALPDVRDGLKPSQRRILVAMNDLGLAPNKQHRKCAKIAGDTSGNYHPHGEAVIYPTLVRMAQDFNMRYTLVDGQGNFGSVEGDSPAAMRYTEARFSRIAVEMLRDIDANTVEWVPNYDETRREPTVLPSRVPNLMVNGASGIAVGMATNIPPHNLGEVVDAILHLVDHPEATADDLMEYVKGPDFPTGGVILGSGGFKEAYRTGRGRVRVRAKAHTEQLKGNKSAIVVTELPYQVNRATLIDDIVNLVKTKKITEISDLRNESDRAGMRLVIELKREAIPMVVLNKLYKHTQMQTTFGIINIALVGGVPRTLTLPEMIRAYIAFQKEIVIRRTKFELDKAETRAHILEGLLVALDNLDAIITIIRKAADADAARDALMDTFELTRPQAQAILDLRLQKLTGLERDQQTFEDVGSRLGLVELELGTPNDDLFLEGDVGCEHLGQRERARHAADQSDIDDPECGLHLRVLVEFVEHNHGDRLALELDDEAHARPVALIAQVADLGDLLLLDEFDDVLDERGAVHLVGQLGDDDRHLVAFDLLGVRLGAHADTAAAGVVGLFDAGCAENDAAGRKVRALDVLHEIVSAGRGVVDEQAGRIDDFAQVVRRDVCRHADGDTAGAVDHEVGHAARQHRRLAPRFIVVGHPLDRVGVEVA